jgi:hypothetical protein
MRGRYNVILDNCMERNMKAGRRGLFIPRSEVGL